MALLLTRAEIHTFKASFFEDDNITPLVPLGPEYPSFTIFDPNGAIVNSGVATLDGLPGNYKVDFNVPGNAPLSSGNVSWRFEWLMVTDSARQISRRISFDVQDATKRQVESSREQSFLTIANKPYRALLVLPALVTNLSLEVINVRQENIPTATKVLADFTQTTDADGSIVYFVDLLPIALEKESTYLLSWTVQETVASPQRFIVQRVFAIPLVIFAVIPSVRMFIDRLQKSLDIIYGYTDADIYEYLIQGMQLVNNFFPRTCYNFRTLPQQLGVYWVYMTAWHALQAQFILDGELAFSSSGQTTTLEVDHTGAYSEAIGRLIDFTNENLPKLKLELRRQGSPVATVAGRQYSVRGYQNYVFKLQSFNSINFPELLAGLGLLA